MEVKEERVEDHNEVKEDQEHIKEQEEPKVVVIKPKLKRRRARAEMLPGLVVLGQEVGEEVVVVVSFAKNVETETW